MKNSLSIVLYRLGLRLDGRRANELRSVNASMGVVSGRSSEGSASFSIGNTRIMATVYGPREMASESGDSGSSAVASGDMSMKSALPISSVDSNEKGRISVKMHAASFSSSGGERRKNTHKDR